MATCLFRSALAFRLRNFWELRVAAGRRGICGQKLLLYLDRFLVGEVKPGGTITVDIVERYIRSIEHLSVGTRINRLSVLRQFCQYLSHFDPRTCIVHRSYLPHRTRPAPHIYSRQEVQKIIVAARTWPLSATDYVLQEKSDLTMGPAAWMEVPPASYGNNGTERFITVSVPLGGTRFYQLAKP